MILKKLICKYFRHDYEPLVLKAGMQTHRCARCEDEIEAFVIMPGECVRVEFKCQKEPK